MTSFPPSYEDATRRDPLPLVAAYLPAADLARASQVCQVWHAGFAPSLFGHPMRNFYYHDGADALAHVSEHFQRLLAVFGRCRPSVQALVYAIHFPPETSSIIKYTSADIAKALKLLPRLQSLIVSNSGLFDNVAVSQISQPSFSGLRYLAARNCQNLIEKSLHSFLSGLVQLQFLDLSFSTAARSAIVIQAIANLQELRILRLRAVGLRNKELEVYLSLVQGSHRRTQLPVRSLDIRDNGLDLSALPELLTTCSSSTGVRGYYDGPAYESTVQKHLLGSDLRGQELYEPGREGLTHVYLSGNHNGHHETVIKFLHSIKPRVIDLGFDEISYTADTEQDERPFWEAVSLSCKDLASLRVSLPCLGVLYHSSAPDRPPPYEALDSQRSSSSTKRDPQTFLQTFPSLRRLDICNVPRTTTDEKLVKTIEALMVACAQDIHRNQKQEMQEIRLELANERASRLDRAGEVRSMLGDEDTQTLWSAAQDDFSFFEDEKNLPLARPAVESLKGPSLGRDDRDKEQNTPIDVAQHLARWRAVRKEAWARSDDDEPTGLAAEHWPGRVSIVQPQREEVIQDPGDAFAWLYSRE